MKIASTLMQPNAAALSRLLCVITILAAGCAPQLPASTATERLPPAPPAQTGQGTILVRQFLDERTGVDHDYIGYIRGTAWGFIPGLYIGRISIREDVKIDTTLQSEVTDCIFRALTDAGYDAMLEHSVAAHRTALDIDAVLVGRIQTFWLNVPTGGIFFQYSILLTLLDRDGQHPLLSERPIAGERTADTWEWSGRGRNYKSVLRWALDTVRSKAATVFASDEFLIPADADRPDWSW